MPRSSRRLKKKMFKLAGFSIRDGPRRWELRRSSFPRQHFHRMIDNPREFPLILRSPPHRQSTLGFVRTEPGRVAMSLFRIGRIIYAHQERRDRSLPLRRPIASPILLAINRKVPVRNPSYDSSLFPRLQRRRIPRPKMPFHRSLRKCPPPRPRSYQQELDRVSLAPITHRRNFPRKRVSGNHCQTSGLDRRCHENCTISAALPLYVTSSPQSNAPRHYVINFSRDFHSPLISIRSQAVHRPYVTKPGIILFWRYGAEHGHSSIQ